MPPILVRNRPPDRSPAGATTPPMYCSPIRILLSRWSATIFFLSLLFLFIFLSGGCTTLPYYAQPHFSPTKAGIPVNGITYRQLTREDFQASDVPERLKDHTSKLNAHTAVTIRPVSGAKYLLTQGLVGKKLIYHGDVENLVFEAVMIPGQSWWNPNLVAARCEYVLQHEQIHFALMELAARRLNSRVQEKTFSGSVFATSPGAVRTRLREMIHELLEESQQLALKAHTAFDEDTSMQYRPKVQQQWYEKVTRELETFAESGVGRKNKEPN